MLHIPAWKKIEIKQQQNQDGDAGGSYDEEDALNVSTHLATGSLTRRDRAQIVQKRPSSSKVSKPCKRQKLSKPERLERSHNRVLRDQLRYLIDFYLEKTAEDGDSSAAAAGGGLPSGLRQLESVQQHLSERQHAGEITSTWKFSKQKQNWLMKHLWDTNAIPNEYNPLVKSYVRGIEGRAKITLTDQCTDMLKKWDDWKMSQQETKGAHDTISTPDDNTDDNNTSAKRDQVVAAEAAAEPPFSEDVYTRCCLLLPVLVPEPHPEIV
ncbi:RNA-binding ribosome assembly factor RBP95 Ecym_1344 [Eremothecium cymbalariae DBVPG|uniref:WKF domain-containing protein n=1 Tax=Eremothecium cymbalariae (strain CBS 270.75 / DBVPG 7215 / KCTC 17166 / NRRL Y-17582) TaxID=931890 RepID=G8JNB4_ERECY|nr:hypothetical protein Ecym_1344 [Eremothecium cymbalariae DBVPG\